MVSPELVRRACEGDGAALERVVVALQPVVQVGIASVLAALGRRLPRDPREECLDLVQSFVLDKLCADEKVLRSWDPERGPLEPYIRRIAQRYAYSKLRIKRARSEVPSGPTSLEGPGRSDVGAQLEARDELDRVLELVEAQLDERGALLFMLDSVEQRSVDEICDYVGITHSALYSWRARIKHFIQGIKRQLS